MDDVADLRDNVELAKLLFEQQFIRNGGRKAGDPTWEELDPDERDEYFDHAIDAGMVMAAVDDEVHKLRYFHAEAAYHRDRLNVEVERLRRELEFWAKAEAFDHEDTLEGRPCACITPEQHMRLGSTFTPPVCARHPGLAGLTLAREARRRSAPPPVCPDTPWCNCQTIPGTTNYPGPWHPSGDTPECPPGDADLLAVAEAREAADSGIRHSLLAVAEELGVDLEGGDR